MKVLRRFFGYGFDACLTSGFGFLVVLISTRVTDINGFGVFALVLAIAAAQCQVATLGFGPLIYGRVASRPNNSFFLLGSAIFVSGIFSVAQYLIALFVIYLAFNNAVALLYALAGLRVLGAVGLIVVQDAMARQAIRDFVPLRVITTAIAGAFLAFAFIYEYSIIIVAAIWGLEGFVFSALSCLFLARRRARFKVGQRCRVHLYKAMPLALQALFIVIYLRFDQIYIGFRFDAAAVGLYAVAARLAEIGNLAFNVMTLVVSPLIISHLKHTGELRTSAFGFMGLLAVINVAICAASYFLGEQALELVFGADYTNGYMILTIYLVSICFVAYGLIASRILASQGITSIQAWSGLAGALSNVILSIVLAELFGMEGVAVATVISYALAVFILWYAISKNILAGENADIQATSN